MTEHITCYEQFIENSSQRLWEIYKEQRTEIERLRAISEYLDNPPVLLSIPQPHRYRLSELLHPPSLAAPAEPRGPL